MTRFVAHITIEAKTPLKVGSNENDILQDSPIQKDWNNLPMILGTSIAGVLRKEFDQNIDYLPPNLEYLSIVGHPQQNDYSNFNQKINALPKTLKQLKIAKEQEFICDLQAGFPMLKITNH